AVLGAARGRGAVRQPLVAVLALVGDAVAAGPAARDRVRRAAAARPGTELRRVAGEVGRRPALDVGRPHDVGRAVVAGAVALLGDVAAAGRRAADAGALLVGGTK